MNRQRTTRVTVIDGTTVTVPEPTWCLGEHPAGLHLADLCHDGVEISATVDTNLGTVELLYAGITQYPYSENTSDRGIKAALELSGAWYRFEPAGLLAAADALTEHAVRLRTLARQLTELQHTSAQR